VTTDIDILIHLLLFYQELSFITNIHYCTVNVLKVVRHNISVLNNESVLLSSLLKHRYLLRILSICFPLLDMLHLWHIYIYIHTYIINICKQYGE